MAKNAIIVGMARSGTSLTASIFAKQGYFVSSDPKAELQDGNKFNPGGFWEPTSLIESNVEVLKAVGFSCHNTWTSDEILPEQAKSIRDRTPAKSHIDLFNSYEQQSPWMWKDPRFCYTLGYWWQMVDPNTTGVLLLTRDPEEIYRSFMRVKWRNDLFADKHDFVRRIQNHIQSARECIDQLQIPHIEVDYSDYSRRPAETADIIGNFFDTKLTAEDLGYEEKFNHSSSRGRLEYYAEKTIAMFPESSRRLLKKYTPGFLQRLLAPSRN